MSTPHTHKHTHTHTPPCLHCALAHARAWEGACSPLLLNLTPMQLPSYDVHVTPWWNEVGDDEADGAACDADCATPAAPRLPLSNRALAAAVPEWLPAAAVTGEWSSP
eukprot:365586-Chlamydomonas_euryale.AAC.2